jgi:N-carbamoyl-L-amino-acid hydrolase
VKSVAAARKAAVTINEPKLSPATPFDECCVNLVAQAIAALDYPQLRMISGTGHDAINIAKHCPTTMIFIPCASGISHNEADNIEQLHAEQGANALLNAVLARANSGSS